MHTSLHAYSTTRTHVCLPLRVHLLLRMRRQLYKTKAQRRKERDNRSAAPSALPQHLIGGQRKIEGDSEAHSSVPRTLPSNTLRSRRSHQSRRPNQQRAQSANMLTDWRTNLNLINISRCPGLNGIKRTSVQHRNQSRVKTTRALRMSLRKPSLFSDTCGRPGFCPGSWPLGTTQIRLDPGPYLEPWVQDSGFSAKCPPSKTCKARNVVLRIPTILRLAHARNRTHDSNARDESSAPPRPRASPTHRSGTCHRVCA